MTTVFGIDVALPGSPDMTAVAELTRYNGIGYIHTLSHYANQASQPHTIPVIPQLTYDPHLGLRIVKGLPGVVILGTYHRTSKGSWRQRVKRKTAGHTWSVRTKAQLPKRLLLEALIYEIQV